MLDENQQKQKKGGVQTAYRFVKYTKQFVLDLNCVVTVCHLLTSFFVTVCIRIENKTDCVVFKVTAKIFIEFD